MNKLGKTSVYVGLLLVVFLTASIYIVNQSNDVRIDVKKTYSEFSIFDNESNSWVLGGEERTILWDGSAKMRASSRVVNASIDNETNQTTIWRYSYFKNGIIAIDEYLFDGNEEDVELFPISHTITILNAKDAQEELNKNTEFILDYEVSKVGYYGETNYDLGSAHEFDHNMKVEWDEGNYYGRVYKYANKEEGKLNIKYRVDSNNFTISARLFDPIIDKDIVFSELISVRSELTYGEAIFEFKNPVDNLDLNDLAISLNLVSGDGIKDIEYYSEVETIREEPKYKEVKTKVKCEETNSTNSSELKEDKCYETEMIEDGYKKIKETKWEKVETLDKGTYKIKLIVTYKSIGDNKLEWFPSLYLDKDKYELPLDMYGKVESKSLIQDKW